jgi:hypothetical protein
LFARGFFPRFLRGAPDRLARFFAALTLIRLPYLILSTGEVAGTLNLCQQFHRDVRLRFTDHIAIQEHIFVDEV